MVAGWLNPFAQAAGYQFVSMTNGRGSATISLPANRFTQPPVIVANATSTAGRADTAVAITARSTGSFEVGLSLLDASVATGRGVYWQAIQILPGSADG